MTDNSSNSPSFLKIINSFLKSLNMSVSFGKKMLCYQLFLSQHMFNLKDILL